MEAKIVKGKSARVLVLSLLLTGSLVFLTIVEAQSSGVTVGYWSLDEIRSDGYTMVTSDSTGVNHGTLGVDPLPMLVDGKFGKAMQFDGNNFLYIPISFIVGFPPSPQPIYMPISPALDIQNEIKIEAWINVQDFKNANYNNIVVKCTHPDSYWQNASRVIGLAIRAGLPEDDVQVVEGALSGFVLTYERGFNEVVTTEYVVPLNHWIHVAFTRTSTGMHLYVNGYEQDVRAIHGVQNPTGKIVNGTEYYFGHDALVTLDDVRISDLAPQVAEAAFDIGPNIMKAVIVVSVVFAVSWLLRRVIQMLMIRPKM
jgi:hypothetical protein